MQAQTAQLRIIAPKHALNFFDSQTVDLAHPMTPLKAYAAVSADMAKRFNWAFAVRDFISSRFGVKRIAGFSGQVPDFVQSGDRLDFFRVEAISDTVLVLTERDRHLDVMTCLSCHDRALTITSSVVTHNAFGRAYMAVVGPAHRIIVARNLRRLAQAQV